MQQPTRNSWACPRLSPWTRRLRATVTFEEIKGRLRSSLCSSNHRSSQPITISDITRKGLGDTNNSAPPTAHSAWACPAIPNESTILEWSRGQKEPRPTTPSTALLLPQHFFGVAQPEDEPARGTSHCGQMTGSPNFFDGCAGVNASYKTWASNTSRNTVAPISASTPGDASRDVWFCEGFTSAVRHILAWSTIFRIAGLPPAPATCLILLQALMIWQILILPQAKLNRCSLIRLSFPDGLNCSYPQRPTSCC